MKVFQGTYEYTETFCHPSPSEWENRKVVLITTLDETLAKEKCDVHNKGKGYDQWDKQFAKVESFELTER